MPLDAKISSESVAYDWRKLIAIAKRRDRSARLRVGKVDVTFKADSEQPQSFRSGPQPVRPDLRRWLLSGYLVMAATVMAAAVFLSASIQRQLAATADAPLFIRNLPLIFVAAVSLALAAGIAFWWLALHYLIEPIERLVDMSEAIRWRGHLHAEESAELESLRHQPAQIGDLASSLMAMEREITARFAQLTTLLETSRVVTGSLDADRVVDRILQQLQSVFQVEQCALLSYDERAERFNMLASRGLGDAISRYNAMPSSADLPSVRALRSGQPVQIADTETDFSFATMRERARQVGFRSILAIPVTPLHAPPAVLLLYKDAPYRYSYGDLQLATSLANHAAVALENAALYALTDERLQEQTQRLEAIVESMRDGVILESLDGQVLYFNQRAIELTGMDAAKLRSSNSAELLQPLLGPSWPPKARTHDISRGQCDMRIHLFDVTDAQGKQLGHGQLWQDVSQDKQLDRMKSALISTVSHELRTPLATIKGYASTLLSDDVEWDSSAQREFIQTINDESDRLTQLVKNLLDMSRIEAGMVELHRQPYLLQELIPQVLRGFPQNVRQRVRVGGQEALPLVPLDLSRITTVLRNLIENAVKYSPNDAPIDVQTFRQNGHVGVAVRDYGSGIPPEHAPRIFDRFYRADNRLVRQVGGAGLGLAICRGFVDAHKGHIWLEHERPGVTFRFTLPVEEVAK